MVMGEQTARRQDIRPLKIVLLNLMPNKIRTETQIARLLGATPLQVEMHLIAINGHQPKNTPAEHMLSFYQPWQQVREQKFDGLVITGAPIEHLPFEEVTYIKELHRVFEWTQTHIHATFAICWGAQAAIHYFHGVQKHPLPTKAFGIYRHRNNAPASPYLRGFSDDFSVPVSRRTETRKEEIQIRKGLEILMESDETGPCLVNDPAHRLLYMFNHVEYDTTSLAEEYERDIARGEQIAVPVNYYSGDDPAQPPENRWRSHAHLLFGNWVNEIYQTTPYDLAQIGNV